MSRRGRRASSRRPVRPDSGQQEPTPRVDAAASGEGAEGQKEPRGEGGTPRQRGERGGRWGRGEPRDRGADYERGAQWGWSGRWDHEEPWQRGGPWARRERWMRELRARHERREGGGSHDELEEMWARWGGEPRGRGRMHGGRGEGPGFRFHPGRGFRPRRPWGWWIQAKLRQKIFLWLALAAAAGVLAGSFMSDRNGGSRGWMILGVLVVAWMGSGVIAWRLTRPLSLVVHAARSIGEGKLDTRIEVRGRGEVAILATAINEMAARISVQLGEQRQLLAAVSHELRTPLGHLRVLLETALERGLPQGVFDQLDREVVDLDHLVGKLMASSRLELSHVDRKPIELGELVAEAALAAGVAPEDISAEGDCRAQVDATLVRRAVANLLDNAARHGGGAVAARVRGGAAEVAIEIDDAGPGVPAERRADAFSAFVPSAAGGLGLGLSLVQRIAAAHLGRAWIEDRPPGGARVGFSVAREAQSPLEAAADSSERP